MANITETNGADIAAECRQWQSQCAELSAERDRLVAELAKVKSERDSYLKTVHHVMQKEYTPPSYTKEELLACVDKEKPLTDFIADLEREMRSDA